MPKCPECGDDYEGSCPNCNPVTSDEETIPGENPEEISRSSANEDAVLLTTVNDNFEATLIETRLKQSGIPTLLKYRESGAYLSFYMGKTSFGVDIYVPAECLDEARTLIEPPQGEMPEGEEIPTEESLTEAKQEYQKRIEFRSWIIFAMIILIIGAAAFISLVVM